MKKLIILLLVILPVLANSQALNNRNEAKTEVTNTLVPILTLNEHEDLMNDEILNSVVFRKDIIATQTLVIGSYAPDFADKDLLVVNGNSQNVILSLPSNLNAGEIKYMYISGHSSIVASSSYAHASTLGNASTLDEALIMFTNKNGKYIVKCLSRGIDKQTVTGSFSFADFVEDNYYGNSVVTTENYGEVNFWFLGATISDGPTGLNDTSVVHFKVFPTGRTSNVMRVELTQYEDNIDGSYTRDYTQKWYGIVTTLGFGSPIITWQRSIEVSGISLQSGTYTIDENVSTLLLDCTATNANVTLPNPAYFYERILRIYKYTGANVVNLTGNIEGGSISASNTYGDYLILISDGTTWRIINRSYNGI